MSEIIIRDREYNRAVAAFKKFKGSFINVGILATAGEYSGDEGGQSIAAIAAANEFGVPKKNIPSRPFMRHTFEQKNRDAVVFFGRRLTKVSNNQMTPKQALTEVGVWYEGQIRRSIKEGPWQPNAPATIRAKTRRGKKGDRPLIDTGRMRKSVSFEIKGL